MMSFQTEQNGYLTRENQRLNAEKHELQREVFALHEQLRVKDRMLEERNVRAEMTGNVSTQTGASGNMPFLQYVLSGAEATMRLRAAIKDAIFRHQLKVDGNVSEGEKLKSGRNRNKAAEEILWELGYANHEIGDEEIKHVRTRINSSLANSKYDQKPEVKARKRQRRMAKKSVQVGVEPQIGEQIGEHQTSELNLSVPQANSSRLENPNPLVPPTVADSTLDEEATTIINDDKGEIIEPESDELDDFDPENPNDPSAMNVGQTLAIAVNNGENDVDYAILLEEPVYDKTCNEWTAKVQFFELYLEDKLGESKGLPRVQNLKHVIMSDVTLDSCNFIAEIEIIRNRFAKYSDHVFI